jgi:hypothetical protein
MELSHGYSWELGQSMETNGTKSAPFNKIDSTAHIRKVSIKKFITIFFQEKWSSYFLFIALLFCRVAMECPSTQFLFCACRRVMRAQQADVADTVDKQRLVNSDRAVSSAPGDEPTPLLGNGGKQTVFCVR